MVLLSDMLTLRYGLRDSVQQLASRLNVPAASLLLGKGSFDERDQCGDEMMRQSSLSNEANDKNARTMRTSAKKGHGPRVLARGPL